MELDALIDLAISYGHANDGRMRGGGLRPLSIKPAKANQPACLRMPGWSPEEMQFVRDNIATMTKEQIGAVLGRTPEAVKIISVRKGIAAASKQPGWMTGNQVARALGTDIHSVVRLHQLGRLPMEVIPGQRQILRIKQITLYRWATRWQNWIYFKPRRMQDERLRRLVELAQSRWTDEWWSVGKIAQYHHVDIRAVGAQVQRGKVEGIRWGNWYTLRSVAVKLKFFKGKGYACQEWSPRADAFIIRARAEGIPWDDIGRMMGWNPKRAMYRYNLLKKRSIGV